MARSRIYLDNNATTALHPRVFRAMLQDLEGGPLNPSSVHASGRQARNLLIRARRSVAAFFGVQANQLIFTSGGTEALNMVLRGLLRKGHVITSDVEHPAVHTLLEQYAADGGAVSFLPAGTWGAVTSKQVESALRADTTLIALMAANNETGVMADLAGIGAVAQQARVPFVVDGVALLGKEAFQIPEGVSVLCFSGHKLHAPKGVGLALLHPSSRFPSLLEGGGQEHGRRGGTENLAGILGLAEALRLLEEEPPFERMRALCDRLLRRLAAACPPVILNGEGPRVSNTLNVSFPGVEAESLLMLLDMEGVDVSHGSACASGSLEVSRVLRNMGVGMERAASSLRFSLSRFSTEGEIDRAVELVTTAVEALRTEVAV